MAKQSRYLVFRSIVVLASALLYIKPASAKEPANDTCPLQIMVRPLYNNAPLKIGTEYYINALGDTFYIDAFRFYISDVCFAGANEYKAVNSHLFDLADTATYSYLLSVPQGRYYYVHMLIGVDSIANISGANEGDLDPMKGMYWAWNSGYIMVKLEGHSTACKTLHHVFEFHIGGYQHPYNAARGITLSILQKVEVSKQVVPTVLLDVDLSKWLNDIDLSKTNSVLIPGKDAMIMADKYMHMLSVSGVGYQQSQPR